MPGPRSRLTVASARDWIVERCLTATGDGRVGLELELLVSGSPDREALAAMTFPGGSRVTFEPGGQVELSGPPCAGVGAAVTAMSADLAVLRAHVDVTARGLDHRPPRRVVHSPRYDAMQAFFDADGPAGRLMMCSTASLQVNLDLGPPERWDLVHRISPVLGAAFANSPRADGTRSARLATWWDIDPTRTAPCRGDWPDYVLDARVMIIRTEPYLAVTTPLTFRQWIEHGHELGWPDSDDLAFHLTTLFPPVRARGWLELRVLDALPDPWWQVASAVTTALVEDDDAAAVAWAAAERGSEWWRAAGEQALSHPGLAAAAQACFAAALDALPRVGADAATVAATEEFVERYVARGRCPADDELARVG
ncbi:MAG TPA: glutamate-cysteine ligase family protein [Acidimicrobiales bacterium]|nr:glutamate-cysteine ligase family protein [Acidimicrobiales bacterium]